MRGMETTPSRQPLMKPRHMFAACPQCGKRIFGFRATGETEVDVTCSKCNGNLLIQLKGESLSVALA